MTTFADPLHEMDKLHDLYESLAEARRDVGQDQIPFHKFADLIKTQVNSLKASGSPEVAFRVAVKDGKVNFTARALKGVPDLKLRIRASLNGIARELGFREVARRRRGRRAGRAWF